MSTSYPLWVVSRWATTKCPFETDYHTAVSQLSARPKREERERLTITLFWGVWGVYPPERAKGTALCIKAFIFFSLCKFYRFSIGVL